MDSIFIHLDFQTACFSCSKERISNAWFLLDKLCFVLKERNFGESSVECLLGPGKRAGHLQLPCFTFYSCFMFFFFFLLCCFYFVYCIG